MFFTRLTLIPSFWVKKYGKYHLDFLNTDDGVYDAANAWEMSPTSENIQSLINDISKRLPNTKVETREDDDSNETFISIFSKIKNNNDPISIGHKDNIITRVILYLQHIDQAPDLISEFIILANKLDCYILIDALNRCVPANINVVTESILELKSNGRNFQVANDQIELIPKDWLINNKSSAVEQMFNGEYLDNSVCWSNFELKDPVDKLIYDLVKDTPFEKTFYKSTTFGPPEQIEVYAGPDHYELCIMGDQKNNKIEYLGFVIMSSAPIEFFKDKAIELANKLNCVFYLPVRDLFSNATINELNIAMTSPEIEKISQDGTLINPHSPARFKLIDTM
jgi:hypothetical protein